MGEVLFEWRGEVSDDELVDLARSHGAEGEAGWWHRVRPHSLGWVVARDDTGLLVGFVNVAWDGDRHAFLLDTQTRGDWQRRGVGTSLVEVAVDRARAAGCEWMHVDYEEHLEDFYVAACGFRATPAGLIRLVVS